MAIDRAQPELEWRHTAAIIVIAAAIIFGLSVKLIGGAESGIASARAETADLKMSLASAEAWANATPTQDSALLKARLAEFETHAREDSDPGELFRRVQNLGKTVGVKVAEVVPIQDGPIGGRSPTDRIYSQSARISIVGNYDRTIQFMDGVKAGGAIGAYTHVTSWEVVPLGNQNVPEVRMTLDLEILRFDVAEKSSTANAPTSDARASGSAGK